MKKVVVATALGALLVVSPISGSTVNLVNAESNIVGGMWGNEDMWEYPTFVYGGSLSEAQVEETMKILGTDIFGGMDMVEVTGEDLVRYLGSGNPDANMYSSALIEQVAEGSGVIVEIVTPENITEVTVSQYANALITAGAEDVRVQVASAVKVSGHSALTGIYKAYEEQGYELDSERMVVAQEELSVMSSIAKENEGKEGFDVDALTQVLIQVKTELADIKSTQHEVSGEEIEGVVGTAIQDSGMEEVITDEQSGKIAEFASNYAETDAVYDDKVRDQLKSLTTQVSETIKNKAGDIGEKVIDTVTSEGFWDGIKNFFVNAIDTIKGIFVKGDAEPVEDEDTEPVNEDTFIEVKVEPVGGEVK